MEVQARQGSPRHHQEEVRLRRLHDAGVPAVRVAVRRRQPPGHILHLRAAGPQNCRWVSIFPSLLSHLDSCQLFTSVVLRSCTGLPATSTADHDSVPGTHGNAAARCRLHTVHCTQFVKISFNTLKLQKQFNFQLTLSHFNKSKSGHD